MVFAQFDGKECAWINFLYESDFWFKNKELRSLAFENWNVVFVTKWELLTFWWRLNYEVVVDVEFNVASISCKILHNIPYLENGH